MDPYYPSEENEEGGFFKRYGLAVAIPSLFGYNYLLTRIKGAQSDMHVFIDEIVAKMAEFYSETADANRTITKAPFSPSEPPMPRR